jgi:hypothetical protein
MALMVSGDERVSTDRLLMSKGGGLLTASFSFSSKDSSAFSFVSFYLYEPIERLRFWTSFISFFLKFWHLTSTDLAVSDKSSS